MPRPAPKRKRLTEKEKIAQAHRGFEYGVNYFIKERKSVLPSAFKDDPQKYPEYLLSKHGKFDPVTRKRAEPVSHKTSGHDVKLKDGWRKPKYRDRKRQLVEADRTDAKVVLPKRSKEYAYVNRLVPELREILLAHATGKRREQLQMLLDSFYARRESDWFYHGGKTNLHHVHGHGFSPDITAMSRTMWLRLNRLVRAANRIQKSQGKSQIW